ncbi:hypothetical protein [Rhodohalobacter barkolensis]|uniref:Uncharacterized protein n=1 Tax=Rhodohalobacter barkolensis TaxID=2053187 RepID=A0A2N0VJY9_9BACT|nr:hypothetical protein [Rhodohalobacter barkolensis]PKD44506.1 hypothetical protein CWD77_03300 [Rhodohalobacter barkolensis]
MVTPIRISLLTLISALLLPLSVEAQDRQGHYMHIDYLQIEPNEEDDFLQHLSSTFVSIQEARKESDNIENWYVYRVTYPGTQNSFYNYVVVTISQSLSGFEDVPDQFLEDFSKGEGQRMTESYRKYLSPNHSELWKIRNSVLQSDHFSPSRYIVMNYMNVGLGYEYEYQMFEDEIARPLHEERMERDQMKGWELHELIMPRGIDYGYNFSTIDYFDNLEDIEFGFTDELIRHTHPDTNINDFFDNIYRTRDLVKSEVWELIQAL